METKSKKNTLWIIIGIVALNSIGLSIVLPLLPFIVGKYLPSQQVVVGMSALLSVFAACTFFAAPVLGALSDRYGRKNILIISLMGSVIGYVLFGIGGALTFPWAHYRRAYCREYQHTVCIYIGQYRTGGTAKVVWLY
jgi:MFS transporter, DHA1 family, tetracycline resistance protein